VFVCFLKVLSCLSLHHVRPVVPKVDGTAPLGEVRNSRGAVKQKWAVGGRWENQLIITYLLSY